MFQVWYSLYVFSSWPGGSTDSPGKSSRSCPSDQVPFSLASRAFICYQPHCRECQLVLIPRWLLSKNGQDSPSPISFPSCLQIRCLEGNSCLFCPISFQSQAVAYTGTTPLIPRASTFPLCCSSHCVFASPATQSYNTPTTTLASLCSLFHFALFCKNRRSLLWIAICSMLLFSKTCVTWIYYLISAG